MSGNKRYNRNHRDTNEGPLVGLARRLGASWIEEGPLDGWMFHRGQWMPVEIKRPEVEGYKHEYTPKQKRFLSWCQAVGATLVIWRTDEDVIRSLGGRRTA